MDWPRCGSENVHWEVVEVVEGKGYPEPEQSSHWGIDYFGDEILFGDDIVEIDGEIILEDNLEDYLIEVIGARFRKAE